MIRDGAANRFPFLGWRPVIEKMILLHVLDPAIDEYGRRGLAGGAFPNWPIVPVEQDFGSVRTGPHAIGQGGAIARIRAESSNV
jgi:hypothetical protein